MSDYRRHKSTDPQEANYASYDDYLTKARHSQRTLGVVAMRRSIADARYATSWTWFTSVVVVPAASENRAPAPNPTPYPVRRASWRCCHAPGAPSPLPTPLSVAAAGAGAGRRRGGVREPVPGCRGLVFTSRLMSLRSERAWRMQVSTRGQ